MNICSAIVYTKPDVAQGVSVKLEKYAGVEVHAGIDEGKLVVTLEGSNDDALAETMVKFNDVKGVINTVMIYHNSEGDSENILEGSNEIN